MPVANPHRDPLLITVHLTVACVSAKLRALLLGTLCSTMERFRNIGSLLFIVAHRRVEKLGIAPRPFVHLGAVREIGSL
jgi:hypothetical protein